MDLGKLNPQQRQAVLYGEAPLLVLAGAGTGKTTVITYRLAHFMHARGVWPSKILAVTFTNKAAREMRERAGKLSGLDPKTLDIGTFHGMCGRILRRHGERIGLLPSFTIYDADDQLQLVRQVAADLKIDPQAFSPRILRARIEQWKNKGLTPREIEPSQIDMLEMRAHQVYEAYEKRCIEANAVDFGDLILHTVTLLKRDDAVREALHRRWSHILVDEYQDTNGVQHTLLKLLAGPNHCLTVVGDDDQSIYRWRGAEIANILRFERDFPGGDIIRLEENYRSTKTILNAANAVIEFNTTRKGKTLFTAHDEGMKIQLRVFGSERDEGEAIGDAVVSAQKNGVDFGDIAMLYRTNAQSRPLEDALRRRRVPYVVYGGVRFYDRKEVKNALGYLRLINNPASEIDFLRVVNVPARGIGKGSIEKLAGLARSEGLPLFAAASLVAQGKGNLPSRAAKNLSAFVHILAPFVETAVTGGHPARLLEQVLEGSGYLQALRDEGTHEAEERIANLVELVAAVDEYVEHSDEPSLAGFLEEITLATDIDKMADTSEQVSLMTLHAAKGLEFPHVFMPGMEEGLFPLSHSLDERAALEEERRLCYVGLTRAMERLYLSAARTRTVFGRFELSELSRFVSEIPPELVHYDDGGVGSVGAYDDTYDFEDTPADTEIDDGGFSPGAEVFHATFGDGEVVAANGEGPKQRLTIDFPNVGRKVIVARFVERR